MLIAIAVATGIIVYVWVMGLSGSLTKSGGTQVSEQLELVAYDFSNTSNVTLHIRNTGGGTIALDEIFYDGNTVYIANDTSSNISRVGEIVSSTDYSKANYTSYYLAVIGSLTLPAPPSNVSGSEIIGNSTISVQGTLTITVEFASSQTSGSSHTLKIVTSDGGTFSFTVVAGKFS